ncbi:alanine racemase [Alteromonas sp. CYL-A6]|uniref:alanine racemase n=1 Tax=Alteromonas nitratireducens TaxID=3390813 RepID=UPI0034BC42B4
MKNSARVSDHIRNAGVSFRPHVKTLKSVEAARYYAPAGSAITVSTLAEAYAFAEAGYTDILYAVTLTPNKLDAVFSLLRQGVHLIVIIDSHAALNALRDNLISGGPTLSVAVELDCDGARAGIAANDPALIELASAIDSTDGLTFHGLVTHAGASYGCFTEQERTSMASQEQSALLTAAERLERAGLTCRMRSLGSTPTALTDIDRQGITEIRAGVFATFDCVMANLGVCDINDIALSVLTRVIKVDAASQRIIVDAGWMALSRDTGTRGQWRDCGYGLVCDEYGNVLDGWRVTQANQEHGIIEYAGDKTDTVSRFRFDQLLRILPVHACATAAQHTHYHLTEGDKIVEQWTSIGGW